MNKKWRAVIITSMIILFVELGAAVFFLFPYYRLQRVFTSIDDGQWTKTQEYYDALNPSQQEKAQSYLDGYGAYVSHRYLSGETDYEHAAASFDAINSIAQDTNVFYKYTPDIDKCEYVRIIELQYQANYTKNSDLKIETNNRIQSIIKRINNSDREYLQIRMLNMRFAKYLAEEISYDEMKTFAQTIYDNRSYSADEYSKRIIEYTENIKLYRDNYETVDSYMEANEYFELMDMCEEMKIFEFDEKYLKLYQEVYDSAYSLGKTYYVEELRGYVDSKNEIEAIELMAKIEARYGDEVDMDFARRGLMKDWQVACMDRVHDWEDYLKNELSQTKDGKYILEKEYEKLRPDSFTLYDVDGNDIPELLFFNKSYVDDDYVGCFVFGYNGKEYYYAGFTNVISFGTTDNIVAWGNSFDKKQPEEDYVLVTIKTVGGGKLQFGESCKKLDGKFYHNDEEVEEIEYMSVRSGILLYQDAVRIKNSGYVSIEDADEYIITYETE